MSLMDTMKGLLSSGAKSVAADALPAVLKELINKLETLVGKGGLQDAAVKAIDTFKPYLAQLQNKEISLDAFTGKVESLVKSLDGAELPADISGILNTVKGLLNK